MNIKELKEITKLNVPIKGIFVISKCELKPFAVKGGFFLQCLLTDLTGSIKGIVWDGAEAVREWVKNKMVMDISGEITRYNDVPQVIIKAMKQKKDYNSAEFLPSLSSDKIMNMVCDLNKWESNLKNDICKKLWELIVPIPRPETLSGYTHQCPTSLRFLRCPGGVGEVHHNYLGGLVEHVYGMIKTAQAVSEYTGLNYDILLTGCLLHDIGKIESYNWDVILEMTDKGRLFHHTYIGYGNMLEFAGTLDIDPNDETFLKLCHIIISHHEDGGLRKPMFPEAQAVSTLDAMDAAVQHALMFSGKPENQDPDSNWTTFCRLTERQYFVPKKVQEIIPEPPPKKDNIKMESIF